MKKRITLTILVFLLVFAASQAQLTKVNENCKQMPCESGLYCVELKSGDKKCATCDQSALNDLTRKVDEECKSYGAGWTPESSQEYNEVLARDGRVLVDVYDRMLEQAKKCKQSRVYREDRCWNGGDSEHKNAISQVAESIERISNHKYKMISDRRVYYGSKSNYESKLSTFNSKCGINFSDINQKLDIMNNDQGKGNKVNCSDIERYSNDCERCFDAAKDLLYDGFSNSSSKFPDDYSRTYNKAEETVKKAKELLQGVKSKSLCN